MDNDELLRLAAQKDSLRDLPRRALEIEMRNRNLGDGSVRTHEQDEKESLERERKERISASAEHWKRRLATLFYLAILFGGVVFADWAISQVLNLPAEATYALTKISLNCALALAVLGIAFARRRLTLNTTLVATGMLSLGLFLWVLWIRNQSSIH
jgi:hypothetical protein